MARQSQSWLGPKAPTYFPDWFPTLATIAKAEVPAGHQLDGVDMTPLLTGGDLPKRHELMIWDFHNYGGIIAIRDGKWKALKRNLLRQKAANNTSQANGWELYDIEADPNETKNLAVQHLDTVKRLEKAWLKTRTVEPDFKVPSADGKKELE